MSTCILSILACVFPPLAVCFRGGAGDVCLNILLTLCAWFPGCIHACIIVNRDTKRNHGMNINQTVIMNQPAVQPTPSHVVVNVTGLPDAAPRLGYGQPEAYHQGPTPNPIGPQQGFPVYGEAPPQYS